MSAEAFRFGEARHPGPVMVVRTLNPAQLLEHEDDISKWPDGVWAAAETSHTQAATQVSAGRFRQNDVRTVFSMPVEKHSCNAGTYRGKAMGTAIMSRLPKTPFPMDVDDAVQNSCRFSDALFTLVKALERMYVLCTGPPLTATSMRMVKGFSSMPFC